jgi:hypothetical protein
MTIITKSLVETIARDAMEKKYNPVYNALLEEEYGLAEECYNSLFSKEVLDQINALPDLWKRTCSCLSLNVGGWNLSLHIGRQVVIPPNNHCTRLGVIEGELAERVKNHQEREKTVREKHHNEHLKLKVFLSSFKTFKKLREVWPEGAEFYHFYEKTAEKIQLPTTITKDINTVLGLGTQGEKGDAQSV